MVKSYPDVSILWCSGPGHLLGPHGLDCVLDLWFMPLKWFLFWPV